MTLSFRSITPDDLPFLSQIYASTRTEELAVVPWSNAEKTAFLQMQFEAQHTYYQQHYADADFLIILKDEASIGRLYLYRTPEEIRIVDIALLPAYRQQGLGSKLLEDILAEARQTQRRVRIHVERFNPALRLYQRLGFVEIGEHGVYYLMEWLPREGQNQAK